MVSSGLTERVSVAPERLMIHLSLALILFAALIWCGLEAWCGQAREDARGPWARGGLGLTVMVFVQSMLGALVAANDAGKVFNDWPLMGGRLVPEGYAGEGLWNLIAHNQASVQFHHRLFGYLLFVLVAAFVFQASRSRFVHPTVRSAAYVLGLLVLMQMVLGIATLLLVAPLWLAILHQVTASLILAVAVGLTWRARRP
jgi:cytochrome c oxidase assembly protein subunit 15